MTDPSLTDPSLSDLSPSDLYLCDLYLKATQLSLNKESPMMMRMMVSGEEETPPSCQVRQITIRLLVETFKIKL